jgi:hypothetical protein
MKLEIPSFAADLRSLMQRQHLSLALYFGHP